MKEIPPLSLFGTETASSEVVLSALAPWGFLSPDSAYRNLSSLLRRILEAERTPFLAGLLKDLSETADPDGALDQLERFSPILEESGRSEWITSPEKRPPLLTILACSSFLGDLLCRDPSLLDLLLDQEDLSRTLTLDHFSKRLLPFIEKAQSLDEHGAALRRFRRREIFRMAARDVLEIAPTENLIRELSDFAEVCIRHAESAVRTDLIRRYGAPSDDEGRPVPFCVLGMGKLGGRELNFSSDIDLMYIYGADGRTDSPSETLGRSITNIEFFTKLAERLTALLSRATEEGPLFRVDLRLRPEGQNGPIALSLAACEDYYSLRGATWERQALIKCRCVGGDDELSLRFIETMTPFIYRKYLDRSSIQKIDEIKRKIEAKVEETKDLNVKLGYGGIREIEFTAQILQLLNGGRCEAIRRRGTLETLTALVENRYIGAEDEETLRSAYFFLRRTEHRLQIQKDEQTHLLPNDPAERELFARRLGFRERDNRSAGELFQEEYLRTTRSVRKQFEELFKRSQKISVSETEWKLIDALDDLDKDIRRPEIMTGLGFSDGEKALDLFWSLSRGTRTELRSSRVRRLFLQAADLLIPQLQKSPDPDHALLNLHRLVDRYAAKENLYRIFLEQPAVLELLVQLASRSSLLTNIMIENPEHFEAIVTPGPLESRRTEEQLAIRIDDLLAGVTNPESRLFLLHDAQEEELLRIGTRHLLGLAPPEETHADLSRLADVLIRTALMEATARTTAKRRWPKSPSGAPIPFCLMALGKLGGNELNFSSDLDLVAFYGGDESREGEISPAEFFTKLCHRFLDIISGGTKRGRLYEADMRLRPMGRNAPIVVPFERAREYYASNAEVWEQLAFVRARFVAGHEHLAEQILEEILHPFVYGRPFTSETLLQILTMRNRLEREALKEGQRLHFKRGYGGLVDIEFLIQSYQIVFGRENPDLRATGTQEALLRLKRSGILSANDAGALLESLGFFNRLAASLQIAEGRSIESLPTDGPSIKRLESELGLESSGDPEILSKTYLNHAITVRELYKILMGALVYQGT